MFETIWLNLEVIGRVGGRSWLKLVIWWRDWLKSGLWLRIRSSDWGLLRSGLRLSLRRLGWLVELNWLRSRNYSSLSVWLLDLVGSNINWLRSWLVKWVEIVWSSSGVLHGLESGLFGVIPHILNLEGSHLSNGFVSNCLGQNKLSVLESNDPWKSFNTSSEHVVLELWVSSIKQ